MTSINDADRLELPPLGPEGLDQVWDEIGHEIPSLGVTVYNHYDRSGNAISMRDWMRLRHYDEEHNHEYKRIAQETIGDYWISTVWIGMNHNYGPGPPMIFETMVFNRKTDESDVDCERYASEAEARAGHQAMVEKISLFAELA